MAAKRIYLLPQAELDIDEATIYLAREASVEIGLRFFDAAHKTFRALLDTPGMGKIKKVNNPKLASIRQWRVTGFEKHLIFYRAGSTGIEIVRVLHGARNIDRVLERETDEE